MEFAITALQDQLQLAEFKWKLLSLDPSIPKSTMICIKFLNLQFHRRLLQREMPLLPNLSMPCCDVRDVAAAHITAMTSPKSPGR